MTAYKEIPEGPRIRIDGDLIPAIGHEQDKLFAFGEQFGYRLVVGADSYDEAEEIAHEHGVGLLEPVDWDADLPTLADYLDDGLPIDTEARKQAAAEQAAAAGDLVHVDGIGECWTDPHAISQQLWVYST